MINKTKFTPGPWQAFIDDTGDKWTGWPISISSVNDIDKSIVRTGGQWPYEWDAAISQREAVANAHLIAAAPEVYEKLEKLVERVEQIQYDHNTSDGDLALDEARAALAKARGEKP